MHLGLSVKNLVLGREGGKGEGWGDKQKPDHEELCVPFKLYSRVIRLPMKGFK